MSDNPMTATPPSERTRCQRYAWQARYDRSTVNRILDATPQAYIGV